MHQWPPVRCIEKSKTYGNACSLAKAVLIAKIKYVVFRVWMHRCFTIRSIILYLIILNIIIFFLYPFFPLVGKGAYNHIWLLVNDPYHCANWNYTCNVDNFQSLSALLFETYFWLHRIIKSLKQPYECVLFSLIRIVLYGEEVEIQ